MTVIAVLADPPREGLVLSELVETTPLTAADAAEFYAAMFRDVCLAAERSGGDLLVNYPAAESIPEECATDASPEAELRALVADALGGTEGVRFEVQVGSSFSARAGNTATHLLREEGAVSVAIVRPTAPFLGRTHVDSAAMKLRSSAVVLGPATDGRVHYAGFADTVDFEGGFDDPELETLTARARDAGHDVDFLPMLPVVERGSDLATALPFLRARLGAERIAPANTAAFVDEADLGVAGRVEGVAPDEP